MRKSMWGRPESNRSQGIKSPQAPTAGVRTETEPEGIVALSGLLTAPGVVLSAGHSPQKSPHLAHRWDALQRAEGAA